MNKIKAIFFDFDNTMVDYIKADILALEAVIYLLPDEVDKDEFIDISVEKITEFHDLVKKGLENPKNMHKYRLSNSLKHFSIKWEDTYLSIYKDKFVDLTFTYPHLEETLKFLHGKVTLGILTNAYDSEEQRRRISKTGLASYFDDIVVCADIGVYKPEKEVFLHLVQIHNLEPGSCIYIGDSEEYDIKGAKSAGLYTIKLLHDRKSKGDSEADIICNGFQELLQILKLQIEER